MDYIKRNYGWILVTLLAILPLFILLNMYRQEGEPNFEMMYHISGEFSIRWMTAVLTCTPFFILFGVNNLFVRQAMGIATAVWSLLHFIIFLAYDGFLETFTQVNYVAGFVAVLLLIPLFLTSNRKSMKVLKKNWKKLQSLVYVIVFLSLLHVVLIEKTWQIYAIIVGMGFILRIPFIKNKFLNFRANRKPNSIS